MVTFFSIIAIILAFLLTTVVLLQHRKQGGFSGVFGSGTQADMSGQWQRFTALTKVTIVIVFLFLVLSSLIVYISK